MPKRKEPPLPPKEQFKRFIDAAREHEVDESGKEFERDFKRVSPSPRQSRKTVRQPSRRTGK